MQNHWHFQKQSFPFFQGKLQIELFVQLNVVPVVCGYIFCAELTKFNFPSLYCCGRYLKTSGYESKTLLNKITQGLIEKELFFFKFSLKIWRN